MESPGTTPAPRPEAVADDARHARRRRRRRLASDLTALALVGVLLIAAFAAGGVALYRELYSPTAFVLRYLDLLADGRATDARALPGVAMDAEQLAAAGLPATASDALLRRDTLATLTDVEVLGERVDGELTRVTVAYRAAGVEGQTTFAVVQDGWTGVAPSWRFATSPLAVLDLTVRGSMRFDVNGFEIDKRQVSADGVDADPLATLPLLVFSPGVYSVAVDTAISATPGVAVLADAPRATVPVDIQAHATEEFIGVVQQRMNEFLGACAAQQVLQPTGCPFGYQVRNRIVDAPAWSIVQQPEVRVEPDGAGWRIVPAEAVAHIDVDVRSLFDGSVRTVQEDVRFVVSGGITVLPDGTASIQVQGQNAP
ncbi:MULTISPECIES: hypothetical protein [Microbacterium]|uniref:DUF2993 domain-containing protein n=1 Tax=Microbacterium wangchenii TaxID=2541726 RepID=A0ABX5T028_9MICO|nr:MULTISPECIES: hypothetical protein [Microbacterium]MCK6066161.1 hypothetical protein [Microbacterium sp. EYE_512]QBR90439.1 hypothetical protein E4K62_18175 [Microbacterium wangchenii]TXK14464.1 hypothetical protein FVP99_12170 [Microbacterium wangchenii]